MAYLCDVFILEPFQGQGLGVWLIETIVSHPDLQGLRRFLLATRDAHGLYSKVGFVPLNAPERWMEIWNPNVYAGAQSKDGESWPPGYFERTTGSLADDPIERPPQGNYEERDTLQ